jgi:transcription elongation factor Elf1
MARYSKNEIIGNMRVIKQQFGKMTGKGLVPYYDVECCNCGRVKNVSHDALRKRKNTGAIKCASCVQEGAKKRFITRGKKPVSSYELSVPYELFKQFISQRTPT